MLEWIGNNTRIVYWTGTLSFLTIVGFALVIPGILIRIPPDYFARESRPGHQPAKRPMNLLRLILLIAKNGLGAFFVIIGIAMLVLPGQGILTILIGLSMLNFPGKFRCERWLISSGPTLKIVNRLRHRYNRPALLLPHT